MGWFRTKKVAVAWVALLALACQLVLTYGHVHFGATGSGNYSFGDLGAGVVATALVSDRGQVSGDPSEPQQKSPNGLPDFCAICASIGLAAALLVPESPVIAAPTPSIQILPWSLAAVEPASLDHLLFDARGPPKA
jgi:hypothetical protein